MNCTYCELNELSVTEQRPTRGSLPDSDSDSDSQTAWVVNVESSICSKMPHCDYTVGDGSIFSWWLFLSPERRRAVKLAGGGVAPTWPCHTQRRVAETERGGDRERETQR